MVGKGWAGEGGGGNKDANTKCWVVKEKGPTPSGDDGTMEHVKVVTKVFVSSHSSIE